MPELMLVRRGNGLFPVDEEGELKLAKVPAGIPYKGKVTVPRQSRAHAAFFGVIADVCRRWPPNLEPYPGDDPELLRAYLLCSVGWRESYPIPMVADARAQQEVLQFADAMVTRARLKKEYPFIRETRVNGEPAMAVHYAKSIEHDALDEVDFRPIADAVYSKIYELTGIDVDDLILEHKTRRPVAA